MLGSLQYLLAGITFGSAGGFTPGPTLTLVISQTLRHGLREGLKIAISPLLTDAPIILLAIFVLQRIDTEPVLGTIAFVGAAFLLYLAYESFMATPPTPGLRDIDPDSLRKGILANLLNPHPWVFWLSIGGPTTLRALEVGSVAAALFLAGHYGCLVGAKVLIAVLVEKGRSRLGRGYRYAMRVLALVLVVFALLFVREGLRYAGLF
jgi:threonine/homoserine/homoserine lactone efflux protein